MRRAEELLRGRVVFNINSTGVGGGVAEMLRPLLAYARGAGVDARWLVIPGNPEFFRVTKRLHNYLHGSPGDGGELGEKEAEMYKRGSLISAEELTGIVREQDVIIAHDPQPGALVPVLQDLGATVIWRCHIGLDRPNKFVQQAWRFLKPHIEAADAYVFSRHAFVWWGLSESKIHIVPPSIDAFSPKNQQLAPEVVESILGTCGLIDAIPKVLPTFTRQDGSPARVDRPARWSRNSPYRGKLGLSCRCLGGTPSKTPWE